MYARERHNFEHIRNDASACARRPQILHLAWIHKIMFGIALGGPLIRRGPTFGEGEQVRSQSLALAFKLKSVDPFEPFPLRSEKAGRCKMNTSTTNQN